jgi:hypothetical protein
MAASIIINAILNIGAREFVNAFNRKKLTIEEPRHVKSSMRPACLISEALYLDAMVVASLDMARDYSRRRPPNTTHTIKTKTASGPPALSHLVSISNNPVNPLVKLAPPNPAVTANILT